RRGWCCAASTATPAAGRQRIQTILIRGIFLRNGGTVGNRVRGGEIGGYSLGDLTGGGPFRTALQGGKPIDGRHRKSIVPRDGIEYAPLAIVHHDQLRFVAAGAAIRRIGVGGG